MFASQGENPFHVVCSMPVASHSDGEDESYSDSTELAVALDEETFPNDGMTPEDDSAYPPAMMSLGEMSKHALPHAPGDRAPSPMGLRQKDKVLHPPLLPRISLSLACLKNAAHR